MTVISDLMASGYYKGVGILEKLETAPNDYMVLSNLTFAVPTHQRWRSESTVSPRNDCYVHFFFFHLVAFAVDID